MAKQELTTTQAKAKEFNGWLESRMKIISDVAPRFYKPERLARIILTEFVVRNPKLLNCTRNSVMGSLLQCAVLGLEPGIGGQCWILPFKEKRDGQFVDVANFVMGYRGFIALGRRSGIISHCEAVSVHQNDTFEFQEWPRSLVHKSFRGGDRGPTIGAYSIAHLVMAGQPGTRIPIADKIEYMSIEEIEQVRAQSKAPNSPAWTNWYDEMAKAKVTKRNFKYLATESLLNSAIQVDDEVDVNLPQSLPANEEPESITAGGQDTADAEFDDIEAESPGEQTK